LRKSVLVQEKSRSFYHKKNSVAEGPGLATARKQKRSSERERTLSGQNRSELRGEKAANPIFGVTRGEARERQTRTKKNVYKAKRFQL